MTPIYRHTQVGYVSLLVGAATVAIIATLLAARFQPELALVVLALVTVVVFLSSLTVVVDRQAIHVWFGPGLIRRRIPHEKVVSVERVRNSPVYGWGLRLTPHGWLWNVAGLEAVQIRFRSGASFRIGTDDPEALVAAIRRAQSADPTAGA